MAQRFSELKDSLREFIVQQQVFFVATAAPDGRVNLSPKGMDSLRVLGADRIVWLNVTGSGNETAAHLQASPRMTLMFCSFTGRPLILRVYGQARVVHPVDPDWPVLSAMFPPLPGARQLFDLRIDLVQTSCGQAVPLFEPAGQREELNDWARRKGEEGLRTYWRERNALGLDGQDTGMLAVLGEAEAMTDRDVTD